MTSTNDQVEPSIPVVDFSKWTNSFSVDRLLSLNSITDRTTVAKQLTDACREFGFVYIINHGLPQEILDEAFSVSKGLFSLSHEQKMQAPHPDGSDVHRGYSYPGLEKVTQYMDGDEKIGEALRQVQDCKESYEVGSEDNDDQPNIWLPEDTLPGFRDVARRFYWECNKVARSILRALALGIGLRNPEFLIEFHSGHNNQLRLLHYPALPAAEIEGGRMARMESHSDWSSITLLFQDECGGLEVEDPHTPGRFIPATPMPGACVMNVGDLLMRWSNDHLKSTKHRVNLPPLEDRFDGNERMTRERYSIVYFVAPDPDSVVECLPVCTDAENPPKYEPVTQRDYGRMRAKVQYRSNGDADGAG